jgi:two-component system cell cycle sensor histidine kinase/response regulator CckA
MNLRDIPPEQEIPALLEDVASPPAARGKPRVWKHRTKDGRILDVEVTAHEISFYGKPARLALLTDVTEQRRLEDQLRQSQKMEAVGRLAGGVAHDFNNLLTVIQGYADLLRNDPGGDQREERTEAIDQIRIASKRAAALTGQLLAFSRQQVLQPKILELNAVVSNLAPMLRRVIGEDIELVTNLDPRGESVLADAGQLEQVIMNLVVNSRDAMPQGGTLTVETGSADVAEAPGIELEAPPGRYARLTVKDTGTGLSPQVQARVFEPFFTTKEVGKGTGLGLATVYGIVKQSGGFVQLHSELGHGATFNVYLPCAERELRRVEPESGIRRAFPKKKIILLIEDEEAVRKLLFSVLSGQGYTVLQASSGKEALAVASGHSGPIHLILSDVVMPGTGGPETVAELQRSRPATQVIFMSGYTDDSVVRHGLTDSGRHFIQKPFTPVTILKKVDEVLKG